MCKSGRYARILDCRWVFILESVFTKCIWLSCICLMSVTGCWLVPREQKPWGVKRLKWQEDCTTVTWAPTRMVAPELYLITPVRYLQTHVHFSHTFLFSSIWISPLCLFVSLSRGYNERKQREPMDGSDSQQSGPRRHDCGKTVTSIWYYKVRAFTVIWLVNSSTEM